jgi:hypothetical protein
MVEKTRSTKVIFLDSGLRPITADPHMAMLFSHIRGTDSSSLLCAVVFQRIVRLIKAEKRSKSIKTTIPRLQKEQFPYLSQKRVREAVRKMREIGVLKIQTSEGAHLTRIWINFKRIVELAEQVKAGVELAEMAKKYQQVDK